MPKLPPFGKPLADLQAQGVAPKDSVNIFIGNKAWKKGENFSISYPTRTLIIPPWQSPSIYRWPVRDCDILIVDTGYAEPEYITTLAIELYKADAEIVRCITPSFKIVVYLKE